MIWGILAANLAVSLIFLVVNVRKRRSSILFFLFFLAVPVLGLLIYYLPILFFRLLHRRNVYDVEDLILSGEEESYVQRPNVEEEMNVVPVSEALAVNDSGEKRNFILNIIKTDMGANYKTILPALGDSDSETSHYAAAAAMEMQRKYRKEIERLEEELAGEPSDGTRLALLDALRIYIESGIVTRKDRELTEKRYVELMTEGKFDNPQLLDNGYYLKLADYLIRRKAYGEAVSVIRRRLEESPSQALYEKLMEIYYLTGDEEKFTDAIRQIRSSGVILSAEGLERLRFWMRREGI